MSHKGLAAATFVILAVAALLGSALAQPGTLLGAQLRASDPDFVNTISVEPYHPAVLRADLGETRSPYDDAYYLDMDGTGTVSQGDVRLFAVSGHRSGSFVRDSDVSERNQAVTQVSGAPTASGVRLAFLDLHPSGTFDEGDQLYLTNGAGGIPPTQGEDVTIRITPAGAYAAGTLVRPGDSDAAAGATLLDFPGGIAWLDKDQTSTLSIQDAVYAVPTGSSAGIGHVLPVFSVRLTEQNDAGPFGSLVLPGHADYTPVVASQVLDVVAAGDANPANGDRRAFMRLSFGVDTDITDDCIILNTDASTEGGVPTVTDFDVRLTPCLGRAAGTLVEENDTVEKQATVAAQADGDQETADAVAWADANNNGRYDLGDYVYLVRNPVGTATASLKTPQDLGSPSERYSIRLTPTADRDPGTFVFAQDADFAAFSVITAPMPAGASFAYLDLDNSGTFTPGDAGYVVPGKPQGGLPVPLNSVRITSDNAAGKFGTHVRQGHSDHATVSSSFPPVPIEKAGTIARLPFGVANDITDDCIVFNLDVQPAPTNFDVRAIPCQGNAAGTLIGDQSLVEKQATPDPNTAATRVRYADVNNNGRYDVGDFVYVVVDTGMGPVPEGLAPPRVNDAAGNSQFTIRMTAADGKPAGTIAFPLDRDFINYRSQTRDLNPHGPFESFAWFDADLTGGYTNGDWLFVTAGNQTGPHEPGTPFPFLSLRWTDPSLPLVPPNGTGTGNGTNNGTQDPSTSPTTPSPGATLPLLLAGTAVVGALTLALRRRRS